MRQRDQSIYRLKSVRPALDEDFTIADKYPEKEKEPALEPIDAPALIVKKQAPLARIGFAHPLGRRKRRELRRDFAGLPGRIPPIKDTTARDITAISQVPGFSPVPLFVPRTARTSPPFISTFWTEKKKRILALSEEIETPERVKISVPIGEFGSGIIEAEKAARTGFLDRFFAWINRILERKK